MSYKFIENSGIASDSTEVRRIFDLKNEVNELMECLKSEGVDVSKTMIMRLIEAILRNCGIDSSDNINKKLNAVIGLITIKSPYTLVKSEDEEKICDESVRKYFDIMFDDEDPEKPIVMNNTKIIYDEVCTFINDLFDYMYSTYFDEYERYHKDDVGNKNVFISHHYLIVEGEYIDEDEYYLIEFDVYAESSINKPIIHIIGQTFSSEDKKCELVLPSFTEEDRKILMAKFMNTADLSGESVEY